MRIYSAETLVEFYLIQYLLKKFNLDSEFDLRKKFLLNFNGNVVDCINLDDNTINTYYYDKNLRIVKEV